MGSSGSPKPAVPHVATFVCFWEVTSSGGTQILSFAVRSTQSGLPARHPLTHQVTRLAPGYSSWQDDGGPLPAQWVREIKLPESPVWGEIKPSRQPMRPQFLLNLSHHLVILVLLPPHQFSLGWNDVRACVCSVRSNFLQSHGL